MSDDDPSGGRRIACVLVPLFPLAARLRAEPELLHEAVAVLAGRGAEARVVAATRRARRAGIRPGFTLSQARARLPKLVARPRDEECERAAREALLDVAESFSPRVEDAGEGVVHLDAGGLERLHENDAAEEGVDPERVLGRALVREAERRAGLPAWVGVAASKLAARVAAGNAGRGQHGDEDDGVRDGVVVVPAGEEASFLAPLSLDRLSPEASTLATLERWGIRSLGEFAALPAAEVVSRLGEAGRELHAIARGEDPRPLVPREPPPTFREGMELEWPLVSLEPFLFVAHAALGRLVKRMEPRGLGCRRLELSLELEPDGHHERSVTLPAPTRDPKTLLTLLRLELEAHKPGAPILAFHLTAHPDRPRSAQLSLFGPEALSADKLATTLARLFSLLGPERVGSPRPDDRHAPEGLRLVPYEPPPPPKERREAPKSRGLLGLRVLRPALPVEVITAASSGDTTSSGRTYDIAQDVANEVSEARRVAEPHRPYDADYDDRRKARTKNGDDESPHRRAYGEDGPCGSRPVALRTLSPEETTREKKPKIQGAVQVASGPWTLEESWWGEEPVERDYWDLELAGGGLYRVYRERRSGDWFVDGVYD